MKQLPSLDGVVPITHVHAHNDNESGKPLTRALTKGVTYIEVDLWLKRGVLYAQHGRPYFANADRKFSTLYLDKLVYYFQKNGSIFYNSSQPLTLVLDIKTDAADTLKAITALLNEYQSLFSNYKSNNKFTKPISFLLSGRPTIDILQSNNEFGFQVDGRISDLGKNYNSDLMPTISEKYSKVVGWRPFSKIPNEQQLIRLRSFADQIHNEGKLFRLWKIPENRDAVQLLLDNGVDIVSLDDLSVIDGCR